MYDLSGRTVLITGASSGIGWDMAAQLGPRARLLILVARRRDRLEALAAKVECEVRICDCDLTAQGAVDALLESLSDIEVDVVINNAGFGIGGAFLREVTDPASEERLFEMLELNILALTRLTRRLLPPMVSRGHGAVLNVGSTAGFQPVPYLAAYSATKAFVNSLSEALAWELQGTGVTVGVLCPGSTRTEFFERAGIDEKQSLRVAQSSEAVAAAGLAAIEEQRSMRISGLPNWMMVFAQRFVPRSLVQWAAVRMFRKMTP